MNADQDKKAGALMSKATGKLSAERLEQISQLPYPWIPELLAHIEEVEAEAIPFSPSPCGHSSQYAHTEDGGKHIVCLLCERGKWRRALNECTPGGSEFADDPEYCKEWVRKARQNQHESILRLVKEKKAAERQLSSQTEAVRELPQLMEDGLKAIARDVNHGEHYTYVTHIILPAVQAILRAAAEKLRAAVEGKSNV